GIKTDLSKKGSEDGKINPTFCEFSLAMAFVLFSKYKVDYILLETGLGGRLDATNIIPNPLACIITRIAIDHQEFLGDTIEEITAEKLGILKSDTPAFFASQEPTVLGLVKKKCDKMNIPYFFCSDSFGFKSCENQELTEYYFKPELISGFEEKEEKLMTLKLSQPGLIGNHQKENISTALASYFYLVPKRSWLRKEEIEKTIQTLKWQGRLQYLGDSRRILIDGAHNVSGMKTLLEYLAENYADKRIVFAIGWKKKKEVLSAFTGFSTEKIRFLPLQMKSEVSEKVDVISQALKNNGLITEPSIDVPSFVKKVSDGFWADYDLLVIAGSLYLLGEFLGEWNKSQHHSIN
ncbi:hypothetical protein KKA14_03930, partial [bacterium]|nr:hypothetical protein [bacterium]